MSLTIGDLTPAALPLARSTLFEIEIPGSPGGSARVPLAPGIFPDPDGEEGKSLVVDENGDFAWEFQPFSERIPLSDLTTSLTAGTSVGYWRPPFDAVDVKVRASLLVASSGGDVVVDMNKNGATMLNAKLAVHQGDVSSVSGSPTSPSYLLTTWNEDDLIAFDIDSAGTGAKGLIVTVTGKRASL